MRFALASAAVCLAFLDITGHETQYGGPPQKTHPHIRVVPVELDTPGAPRRYWGVAPYTPAVQKAFTGCGTLNTESRRPWKRTSGLPCSALTTHLCAAENELFISGLCPVMNTF